MVSVSICRRGCSKQEGADMICYEVSRSCGESISIYFDKVEESSHGDILNGKIPAETGPTGENNCV